MKKQKIKVRVFLIFSIVIVLVIAFFLIGSTNQENANPNLPKTDLVALKQSQLTSESFDVIELGYSKSEVEEAMGALTAVPSDTGYDVFSVTDEAVVYYFYFEHDSLENVSVVLKS